MSLSSRYDPSSLEAEIYRSWEERGYFRASAARVLHEGRKPYAIVIPPPNVTAVLHMGHGLNNTLQDVLTRWRRMQGWEALYLPGTDHAGIATQNVVERMVAQEGTSRHELGREAFVKRVWSFVDETGSTILRQLRAIGCSCDWSRTRFTLEADLSRAVREVFVRLYEKGLIYRGSYIVNWCPRCLTALSDEEAEAEDVNGKLWHLRYPLAPGVAAPALPRLPDGRPYLVVATTRPETMLGDTAVAVHPEDERYLALIGREIDLPLTGRRIPVVGDTYADPEFGSGAVKITPAHDPNDFEVARRQNIPALDVLTPDAKMNDNVPEPFRGLDRFEARKRVVAAFEAAGLLERIEDHRHAVPHCYRCNTVVEPRLSEQWFVRMKPLAEPALQAARDGRVRFTPERWTKVYENWMENIRDWCISRQLWWGHRIPVWYCRAEECRHFFASRTDPERCENCGATSLEQDPDVLDTWFSSWLWPFSTLGWPEQTDDLRAFYPTQTLVTAPEILFFWVARMIMAGLEFMGDVPFADVYLNGTVRDMQGRKMSKSLGNGIDPLEVVRLYGADALRFTVIDGQGFGTDVRMDPTNLEETFKPGRNFANKVWNAGRLVLMNVEGARVRTVDEIAGTLELADRWILSRFSAAVRETTRQLEAFRFHEATESVYQFFWSEFAPWYLEMVKARLGDDVDAPTRDAARATLVEVMDGVLRLLHPFMPFLTETLWTRLPLPEGQQREESLVLARWPEPRPERTDTNAELRMNALMDLIDAVRGIRSDSQVPEDAEVSVHIGHTSVNLRVALQSEGRALRRLARVAEVHVHDDGLAHGVPGAIALLRGGEEVFIPLAGVIDLTRERLRIGREVDRLTGALNATEAKLANEQFVARAPADVVAKEREKAVSYREQRDRLAAKLTALE
jgi:valyl-tRNA synthetase